MKQEDQNTEENITNRQEMHESLNVAQFMKSLIEFEAHTTKREFQNIFGMDKGSDMWQKFSVRCSSNTTIFYRVMEEDEQQRFDDYIERLAKRLSEKR